jgi:hypothetical protein
MESGTRALDRIRHATDLVTVVPQLRAEVLHHVIRTCGLEACGDLVALATPEQLTTLCDLDLWRAATAGGAEEFDAGRFGEWIETLVEHDPIVAAQKLTEMDARLVVAGLAEHVRVFDHAAIAEYTTTDGDRVAPTGPHSRLVAQVGGFMLADRREDAWDAILVALAALAEHHPGVFRNVMSGCRALSNSASEIDGLDELPGHREQAMFDLARGRELRREPQGYISAEDGRAFLELARRVRIGAGAIPPPNHIAQAHLRARARAESADERVGKSTPLSTKTSSDPEASEAVAVVMDILRAGGILPPSTRGLLEGSQGEPPRLTCIQLEMQALFDRAPEAYAASMDEFGFLANAVAAGCTIQGRALSAQEAWDAAVATCNLGIEMVGGPGLHLADGGVIGVFQVGWTALHDDVAMAAAVALVDALARVRCGDGGIQRELGHLRGALTRQARAGTPWRARRVMDVLASLDLVAWTALVGLIAECPIMHSAVVAGLAPGTRTVSVDSFEFISERSQLQTIRAYLDALTKILSG